MNDRGTQAREEILEQALSIASVEGLDGLTLGALAKALGRSKSGLFAHFENKEALQLDVLETAAQKFADEVIRKAIFKPRGLARLEALFANWGIWAREESKLPGGCVFVSASSELDDKPGPVRDRLVQLQQEWLDSLERVVGGCVTTGELKPGTDTEQIAFEIYSVMLGSHLYFRLLGDRKAGQRVLNAFDRIVDQAR